MDSSELKHKTFDAVIWAVARIGASNILGFIVFAVLARELSPREFGVYAVAILVIDIARAVSGAGLSDAITRDKEGDEVLADTAFWTNLGLGCILGTATWMLAPLYARLMDQPELTTVLHWLAVLIPISALGGMHTARKLREFGHKAIAARTISCNALGGMAAVAAAVAGLGVWSLVIQVEIVETIGVIFAWQSYRWWPRPRVDLRRLAKIWTFSGTMTLTQVMGLLLTRIQDIVIGTFISVAAVGSYRIAWRMIDLIAQMTVHPIVSVSYVTLARLQDDPERFRSALLRMLGLAALVALPAIAGLGVLSSDVIPILFGPKWAASADIVSVMALMAVPFCMNLFLVSALAATGRTTSIAKSAVLQAVAALVLSLLAAPFGVIVVAAAYVLRAYLTLPYHLALFKRDTGVSADAVVRVIVPPLLGTLMMIACLIVALPFLREALGQSLAFLAVAVLSGGAVYFTTLLVFATGHMRANVGVLMPLWKGYRPQPATQS